jgi:hypothetical protein
MVWADGDYTFRLAWGQIAELQDKCDAGPYVILQRLTNGQWRIQDISETIRLGLIGGGQKPVDAVKLVRTYVEARPPLENVLVAQAILGTALIGSPEEDRTKKKDEPESRANRSPTSRTEKSASQPSTASEP